MKQIRTKFSSSSLSLSHTEWKKSENSFSAWKVEALKKRLKRKSSRNFVSLFISFYFGFMERKVIIWVKDKVMALSLCWLEHDFSLLFFDSSYAQLWASFRRCSMFVFAFLYFKKNLCLVRETHFAVLFDVGDGFFFPKRQQNKI